MKRTLLLTGIQKLSDIDWNTEKERERERERKRERVRESKRVRETRQRGRVNVKKYK